MALAPTTEAWGHAALAEVLSCIGRTEDALTAAERALRLKPFIQEATEVLRLNPNFSLAVHKQRMPIKDPAVLERQIAALRKARLK